MIPEIQIEYLSDGWVPHLRERLSVLDGIISQRLGDDSTMEVIADCKTLTTREKLLANETRMWLQISYVSAIADMDGNIICWERLTGK